MSLPRSIFRAYDVRGVYPAEINEETSYHLGRAFAELIGGSGKVLVGRDVRLSGESLASALTSGLVDGGLDAYQAGVVPTPALYLGVVEGGFGGGVQVTASHNPPEWNGFKFVLGDGETVSEGAGMEQLRRLASISLQRGGKPRPIDARAVDLIEPYIEKIAGHVRLRRRVRVAVDFSNGATCVAGRRLLERIGCDVLGINDVPDGRFPAHPPEPREETLTELMRLVREEEPDLGVAFDGDGDRAVFIDDRGRMIEGDMALAVIVMKMNRRGRVVYDVSSSTALEEVIARSGCEPVLSRVGRAFMLRKVRETGAIIGGEKSNHLYFSELYGFDDGIFAAARMAEIVSGMEERLSSLIDSVPRYPSSPIYSIDVSDDYKFLVVERVAERLRGVAKRIILIDGVKAYLDGGWILIRASNTMPQIKYTAEAENEELLRRYLAMAQELIGAESRALS